MIELFVPHDRILVAPVLCDEKTSILLPAAYKNHFQILTLGAYAQRDCPFDAGDLVVLNKNVAELSEAGYVGHAIALDPRKPEALTHVHSIPLSTVAFVLRST